MCEGGLRLAPAGSDTENEPRNGSWKTMKQTPGASVTNTSMKLRRPAGTVRFAIRPENAASSADKAIRRITRLPTLPDGSGEGGLEMTHTNQVKKNDDFKLVIVFRIEGKNCRSLLIRLVGIVATLIAIGIKVTPIILG